MNAEEMRKEGITIQNELELLKSAENYDKYYWIKPLKNVFDGKIKNLDGETAAAILTDYYNDLEKQAREIREQLNNYFLYRLMESMTDTAYPFWETDGAVLDGFEEVDDDVYTEELDEALTEAGNLLCKITDENQAETMKDFQVDMKAMFAKHLPMFNLEGLLETITCEYTYFEGLAFLFSFLMIGMVSIIVVPMRNLNLDLYQRIGIIFESMPCVDTIECDVS